MDTQNLFKYRSVTACMKASFDFMYSNYKSLFKSTWWGFLTYSVLMALVIYLRMPNKFLHDWGVTNPLMSFILQTVIYTLSMAGTLLATGVIWSWINKKKLIRNIGYSLISDILTAIGAIIVGLACTLLTFGIGWACKAIMGTESTESGMVAMAITAVISFILALIFLLPFTYVNMRLLFLETKEKIRPWQAYKMGLRHWGGLFKMGFISWLVVFVIMLIIAIPAMILTGAQALSQLGALDGDSLGTPVYFVPLFIIVLTLIIFIYSYITSWITLSYAYLYASYETQEKEKMLLKEKETQGIIE